MTLERQIAGGNRLEASMGVKRVFGNIQRNFTLLLVCTAQMMAFTGTVQAQPGQNPALGTGEKGLAIPEEPGWKEVPQNRLVLIDSGHRVEMCDIP